MKTKYFFSVIAVCFTSMIAVAQCPMTKCPTHKTANLTLEERTARAAKFLQNQIQLTDKQYEQVYKMIYKDLSDQDQAKQKDGEKCEKSCDPKTCPNKAKCCKPTACKFSKDGVNKRIETEKKMMKILDDKQFIMWEKLMAQNQPIAKGPRPNHCFGPQHQHSNYPQHQHSNCPQHRNMSNTGNNQEQQAQVQPEK